MNDVLPIVWPGEYTGCTFTVVFPICTSLPSSIGSKSIAASGASFSGKWYVAFTSSANLCPPEIWSACKCVSKTRSEEHTSELQSRFDLVCLLLLEQKQS